jgi:hypothetical protein
VLKDNLLKYGVLTCRDLVELYYGWRIVSFLKETSGPVSTGNPQLLIDQDPRRISYEITLSSASDAGVAIISIGTQTDVQQGLGQDYYLQPQTTIVVRRSFLTDLDTVCQEVWFTNADGFGDIEAREVILTPAPVDEVPLG